MAEESEYIELPGTGGRQVLRLEVDKDRYWLFAGDCYYAAGGMHDFRGSFESSELAQQHTFFEWWHVWDTVEGKCVASSERQPFNAPSHEPRL